MLDFYSDLLKSYTDRCSCIQQRVRSSGDHYVDTLCDETFPIDGHWSEVSFPEEQPFMMEAFLLLGECSSAYYFASYMWEALKNPYYRFSSCLLVEDMLKEGSFGDMLIKNATSAQRESVVTYFHILADQDGASSADLPINVSVLAERRAAARILHFLTIRSVGKESNSG